MSNESEMPPEVREYLRARGERLGKEHGARGGKTAAKRLGAAKRKRRASKAGKAGSAKLTPAARTERARQAARARWAEARKEKTE